MTKVVQLDFGRDVQGFNAYAPGFAVYAYQVTLANGGSASLTIPNNYSNWIMSFSYVSGTEVWVSSNGTAGPPGSGNFTLGVSELNPASRTVKGGDVINAYNNGTAGNLGVTLYAVS